MSNALISLLLAISLVSVVEARTVIEPSKQKSASLASVVAKVEITKSTPLKVEGTECAYEYEAKVLSIKKGTLAGATSVRFGVLGGLEVGRSYLVYLRNLETKSEYVNFMVERSSDLDATLQDKMRPIIEACPITFPFPMSFRADRVAK